MLWFRQREKQLASCTDMSFGGRLTLINSVQYHPDLSLINLPLSGVSVEVIRHAWKVS